MKIRDFLLNYITKYLERDSEGILVGGEQGAVEHLLVSLVCSSATDVKIEATRVAAEKREIVRAEARCLHLQHVVLTDYGSNLFDRFLGQLSVVFKHGIFGGVIDLRCRSEALCGVLAGRADDLFEIGHDVLVERAESAGKLDLTCNYVARRTAVDRSDRHDSGCGGGETARGDGLKRGHYSRRGNDSVDALLGVRAVA